MHALTAVVGCSVLIGAVHTPIAIHHEVSEARYRKFGESFPAVVQVGGLASGVLVAPDWVLTVAHAPEMLRRMRPDDPLTVRVGEVDHVVARVVVPEERVKEKDRHDIALLQLEEPVAKKIAPLPLHDAKVAPGAEFAVVGWGVLAQGDVGIKLTPAAMAAPTRARRAGWNQVTRVDAEKGLIYSTFDDGDERHELEAAPCIGDSGGPVLIRIDPEEEGAVPTWEVAGVIALVDDKDEDRILGEYGEEFGVTAVKGYARWIRKTLPD